MATLSVSSCFNWKWRVRRPIPLIAGAGVDYARIGIRWRVPSGIRRAVVARFGVIASVAALADVHSRSIDPTVEICVVASARVVLAGLGTGWCLRTRTIDVWIRECCVRSARIGWLHDPPIIRS